MKTEIWKDIKGYENIYQVSNFGRVRSLDRTVIKGTYKRFFPGKIIKQFVGTTGYPTLLLKYGGQFSTRMVHRIVGETFIENVGTRGQINHIDNDKTNNHIDNLEWVNQSQNIRHAFDNGHHSGVGDTHYKAKKIYCGINGITYGHAKAAAEDLGISKKTVFDMCTGKVSNRKQLSYL